jgi:hypothetical protein
VFEGLGIGSRLATVSLPARYAHLPIVGAVVFGMSTPLGMAVGLAMHASYNADDPGALVVSGVLDSLSAGILLYTALVEVRLSRTSIYICFDLIDYAAARTRDLIQRGANERACKALGSGSSLGSIGMLCYGTSRKVGVNRHITTVETEFCNLELEGIGSEMPIGGPPQPQAYRASGSISLLCSCHDTTRFLRRSSALWAFYAQVFCI